jgi:hypothetical protein
MDNVDCSQKRIEEFKKKYPSIKWVERVCVDTGVFKADSEVISMADVEAHTIDKQEVLGIIQKLLKAHSKELEIAYKNKDKNIEGE